MKELWDGDHNFIDKSLVLYKSQFWFPWLVSRGSTGVWHGLLHATIIPQFSQDWITGQMPSLFSWERGYCEIIGREAICLSNICTGSGVLIKSTSLEKETGHYFIMHFPFFLQSWVDFDLPRLLVQLWCHPSYFTECCLVCNDSAV